MSMSSLSMEVASLKPLAGSSINQAWALSDIFFLQYLMKKWKVKLF